MTLTATAQLSQNVASGKELQVQSLAVTGGTIYATTVRKPGGGLEGVATSFVPTSVNTTRRLNLLGARDVTGLLPTVAAQAGIFGISLTPGTSEFLLSEAANNNTKTDVIVFEHVMSDVYVAAVDFNVVVNAHFVIGGGTLTTKTIGCAVYKVADAGTQGSTIETTAAQVMTGSAADYTFAVTGATISPGDRIMIKLTMILAESASSNVTGRINSVRVTNA